MNYTLKRSHRKTIALHVRDGELLVRAPYHVSDQVVNRFVLEKDAWIQEKLQAYRKPGIDFTNQSVFYFGQKQSFKLKQGPQWSMNFHTSMEIIARSNMTQAGIEKRMEEEFKVNLDKVIQESLVKYSKALKIKTPSYVIRKYKRIHGRCLSTGQLAFNTLLYEHSVDFIDYVVLHECAHLIEFNHSKRFYQIIEKHLPNYKAIIQQDKTLLSLHQDQ